MKFIINLICCAIPVPDVRRRIRQNLRNRYNKNKPEAIIKHLGLKPIILWIDHALGGGTEVYSLHQFKQIGKQYEIIRLQFFPAMGTYQLTNARNKNRSFATRNLNMIYQFCYGLNIYEIIVNNIVAYKDAIDILNFVKELKENTVPQPRVSFRGHDFHCICPSYNLVNCDGKYCAMRYGKGCENCWQKKQLGGNPESHNILKSGAKNISDWRNAWGDFFKNTTDYVIVFSNAVAGIFTAAYPQLENKIQVVPHTVRRYNTIKIKPHNEINIAVLGAISYEKGADVIREMAQHLPENTKIKVIGIMNNPPDNIFVHGRYKQRQLPRIMKKHKIDLVFISSICPETFSYTTSEAMELGLPVACYDMGAPAERVSKYSRGLILKKISPQKNLVEIVEFIKKQRLTK